MADQPIDPRAQLIEDAWANPKSRPLIEQAVRVVRPEANLPGLAMREAAESFEKNAAEKQAAFDAKLMRWEVEQAHKQAVEGLKKQGYNDAQVKEIEDIMEKEGVGTHQNAATLYDARREVAKPRSPADPRGSMSPRAYGRGQHAAFFNGIMEGEFHHPGEDWARSKADMILEDFRNNRAEAEAKWGDQSYWPADPNFPVKTA